MKSGLLLINVGTPRSTQVRDVRRYLREFLSDERVIDIAPWARQLLLNLVILPFRPRKSAAAYRQIWTDEGSPLLTLSRAQARGVSERLADYEVVLAMRYGEPSIAQALQQLRNQNVDRIVVLPLYPQYSSAATGSAVQAVIEAVRRWPVLPALEVLGAFYDEPTFLDAFAETARPVLDNFKPDHLLFSYHGLPERQVRATDDTGTHCLKQNTCCDAIVSANRHCYRAQCFATTRALVDRLRPAAHSTSFQSRLGRTPWIQPFSDVVVPELARAGVKRLAVMCPSFVADCLETLEEVAIRTKAAFCQAGGEDLCLVPSLNVDPMWLDAIAKWVTERRDAHAGT